MNFILLFRLFLINIILLKYFVICVGDSVNENRKGKEPANRVWPSRKSSKKSRTTFITVDPYNFKHAVQQYTGQESNHEEFPQTYQPLPFPEEYLNQPLPLPEASNSGHKMQQNQLFNSLNNLLKIELSVQLTILDNIVNKQSKQSVTQFMKNSNNELNNLLNELESKYAGINWYEIEKNILDTSSNYINKEEILNIDNSNTIDNFIREQESLLNPQHLEQNVLHSALEDIEIKKLLQEQLAIIIKIFPCVQFENDLHKVINFIKNHNANLYRLMNYGHTTQGIHINQPTNEINFSVPYTDAYKTLVQPKKKNKGVELENPWKRFVRD
ncbi:hypothetical protein Mgra_00003810 [Meloidogyne graminicola]|uniref:VQ domain-containing protein n=1 Tax=Meloidogyne graminicola TaxID=189291 RepID=A0A8S9ZUJ6_9BILA|nr:hypothetical protein Mgra_00003810 [Meloidogyne graminicola]